MRQGESVLKSGGVNESMPLEAQQQESVLYIDPRAVFRALLLDLCVNEGINSEPEGEGMCR